MLFDDSFDNEYDLVRKMPNERIFCMIFSYAYDFHVAEARFQMLGRRAIKFYNKSAKRELAELCVRDEDICIMHELLQSMRSLGLRPNSNRYDIEFPTRNHLKVFLMKLITKRRRQLK